MKKFPSKEQIINWIKENPAHYSRRDIAQAFGIKGAARTTLKQLLAEMKREGTLPERNKSKQIGGLARAELASVIVGKVLPVDDQGDIFIAPLNPSEQEGDGLDHSDQFPRILYMPQKDDHAIKEGDSVLVRLSKAAQSTLQSPDENSWEYEARLIRRLSAPDNKVIGIFEYAPNAKEEGRILPVSRGGKGADKEWRVPRGLSLDAQNGELVEAKRIKGKRLGLALAEVTKCLGNAAGARAFSLIAIHQHAIPDEFTQKAIFEAEQMLPATPDGRSDLRDLPFVTIDPADARDRDDAVYALDDSLADNPGGFVIWVAIADVAYYVLPDSALDREARLRGNSSYFPDRVVPMLPDVLSGDLCSLHEGVDRPVIALKMRITADGVKIDHHFYRALIRSVASLSYEEAQQAIDGVTTKRTKPLVQSVLRPLYHAYAALKKERAQRQPLELDLPERKIVLSEDGGDVFSIALKERLDAHRVIEEMMVLANVAAAQELKNRKTPLLFRVHEEPSAEKIESLRDVAQASGFGFAKGQVIKTSQLNRLLSQARGSDFEELLSMSALRSMQQAYYSCDNLGHFGLALRDYAHFTSPIRRYADLVVHRGLIAAHGWAQKERGDKLSSQGIEGLKDTAKHISDTERRSMQAERDTTDRYVASYLSSQIGSDFVGHVSGVHGFGLFVRLNETGADGLIPIRSLGNEFFTYDEASQSLTGSDTGLTIRLGQKVTVRLIEAAHFTGSLVFELRDIDGAHYRPGAVKKGRHKGAGRSWKKYANKGGLASKLKRSTKLKRNHS